MSIRSQVCCMLTELKYHILLHITQGLHHTDSLKIIQSNGMAQEHSMLA